MTIDELIQRLEEYRELMGGDAEVRLMTQENWPFEYAIAGVVCGEEINADPCDANDDNDVEDDNVVYIVEGRQLKYGSRRAWDLVRVECPECKGTGKVSTFRFTGTCPYCNGLRFVIRKCDGADDPTRDCE